MRPVPEVLPDSGRVGAPRAGRAHGTRAAPVEQTGRQSAGPFCEADEDVPGRQQLEDLLALQQEVPLARFHADPQEDAHGRAALLLRVLQQGVQREE